MILASKQIEEDDRNLKIVEDKEKKTRSVLEEASYNLNQMDCAKAIRECLLMVSYVTRMIAGILLKLTLMTIHWKAVVGY